jgi:hypothetical protein
MLNECRVGSQRTAVGGLKRTTEHLSLWIIKRSNINFIMILYKSICFAPTALSSDIIYLFYQTVASLRLCINRNIYLIAFLLINCI